MGKYITVSPSGNQTTERDREKREREEREKERSYRETELGFCMLISACNLHYWLHWDAKLKNTEKFVYKREREREGEVERESVCERERERRRGVRGGTIRSGGRLSCTLIATCTQQNY